MALHIFGRNMACVTFWSMQIRTMLDRRSSLLIAATLVLMASIIALVSGASWTIIAFLFIINGLSLAILYVSSPMNIEEPTLSYGTNQNIASGSLIKHPDFALWADQESDPVIGVQNKVVILANDAAIALLGRHIVGADIRTAIRHPSATELFDKVAQGDQKIEPANLDDYPRAGQRWAMRVAMLSANDAIIFLADRSVIDAADRMRSDFVANASHELRTPLAAILGYVETLQDMMPDGSSMHQRFLGIIDREANRMQRLIIDLLSISRLEADRFRRPIEQINLTEVVSFTINQLKNSVEKRPEDISSEILDHPLWIKGDRAQISQMTHNIIANAMKYGRAGTPIIVRLGIEKNRAIFQVQDEGEGISAEHLPRLTERFYRVDDARSRSVGGTGLGLAIVKHISERHQGQFSVDSIVNKGTTVSVSLPLLPPEDKAGKAD